MLYSYQLLSTDDTYARNHWYAIVDTVCPTIFCYEHQIYLCRIYLYLLMLEENIWLVQYFRKLTQPCDHAGTNYALE